MELKEIKDLIKSFDQSESCYFEFSQGDMKIKLKKQTAEPQVVVQASPALPEVVEAKTTLVAEEPKSIVQPQQEGEVVKAPLVGVFYAAPSPEEKAFVQVGSQVQKGQVLCFIEAMKMMSEITAPTDGVIKEIYVKNQDVVEFETPLFLIGD